MAGHGFQQWQRDFRKAAKADKYTSFRDHLRRLDFPDNPEWLLEGTIHMVLACLAYASMDGQPSGGSLGMQKYDPGEVVDARYAVTFDLYGKAFARILTPPSVAVLDFADLYGHPWESYKRCGYNRFWISRIDGRDLSRKELIRLEQEVTDDLRFDYSEDEIEIWFDDVFTKGSLLVTVQDRL